MLESGFRQKLIELSLSSWLEVRRCGIVGVFAPRMSFGKLNAGTDDADEHAGDAEGSNQP
jgi:hypothetical protein